MSCSFTIATLVSLISVEVSSNLLEQPERDQQIILPGEAQPWERVEYYDQPNDPLGRSFTSNDGPRTLHPNFSVSLSQQTVDAPPSLPQPSSGGCSGNPEFLNFPGQPSMVFNPSAHVNFVIGVPEGYRMEVSNAPEGWKIITITAPEGTDAVTKSPDLQLSPLLGNVSPHPAGLNAIPNTQFPFMRPMGSPAIQPSMNVAAQPSKPSDDYPDAEYPGLQVSGTGRIDRPLETSERYPDVQYAPAAFGSSTGPIKPGPIKPGLRSPGMESYSRPRGPGSDPDDQYLSHMSSPSGSFGSGYNQPGEPGIHRPTPSRPEMYSEYPVNEDTFPEAQSLGQLKFFTPHGQLKKYPEQGFPDARSPFSRAPSLGYKTGPGTPGNENPDVDYKTDNVDILLESRSQGTSINHRSYADEPGPQTPGSRRSSASHQPPDRSSGEKQPDYNMHSPSSSMLPGSSIPQSREQETEKYLIGPSVQAEYPNYHHPDKAKIHSGARAPEMGTQPQQQEPFGKRFPDDLNNPSGELLTVYNNKPGPKSPGMEKSPSLHQPSDRYPNGIKPHYGMESPPGPLPLLGNIPESYPQTPGLGKTPKPSGQHDAYHEIQYPDYVNHYPGKERPNKPSEMYLTARDDISPNSGITGLQTPEMERPQGPSETTSYLGPGLHRPGSPETLEKEKFPTPTLKHESSPDDEYPDNINTFPDFQAPITGTSSIQHDVLPDGMSSSVQRSPSHFADNEAHQSESYIVPRLIEPGSQNVATDNYGETRQHSGRFQGYPYDPSQPSGGRPSSEPLRKYLGDDFPDSQSAGSAVPGYSYTPKTGEIPSPTGAIRYPESQSHTYINSLSGSQAPIMRQVSRQSPQVREYPTTIPLRFPSPGQNQPGYQSQPSRESPSPSWKTGVYPGGSSPYRSNRPQGSQLPADKIPNIVKGSTEAHPEGQYPDEIFGLTLPIEYKPGHPIPSGSPTLVTEMPLLPSGLNHPVGYGYQPRYHSQGINIISQPSGPGHSYPDHFNHPHASQTLITDIPLQPSGATEDLLGGMHPDKSAGFIHPLGPEYQPPHLIPGTNTYHQQRYPQGVPSQKQPEGQYPDSSNYSPRQQALSPTYQSGPQIPSMERFPQPNGPQSHFPRIKDSRLRPSTGYQYPEGYLPEFRVIELGKPRPTVRSNQGSGVQFPDYLRYLLEPYLTPRRSPPSSSSIREYSGYQIPGGQYMPDGYYRENHYPDNMVNRPGHMGLEFTQPEYRSHPEPSDRYRNAQGIQHTGNQIHPNLPHGPAEPSPEGGTSVNTMDFPEGKAPQGQDGVKPSARSSPRRETEHHSPQPGSAEYIISPHVPSGPYDVPIRMTHGSPKNTGNPSEAVPSYQSQPLPSTIFSTPIPNVVRVAQDSSQGGKMPQPQSPHYISEVGPHSPENRPAHEGSPAGTLLNQQIPSMGMITEGTGGMPGIGPGHVTSSSGRNTNPQGHVVDRPESGTSLYSGTITRPHGPQVRTVTIGGSPGGQIRTAMRGAHQSYGNEGSKPMIITYPTNSTSDIVGSYGSPPIGPSVVRTAAYQTTPTAITRIVPLGGYNSHSAPSTSYKTIYPANVQSGAISYSGPSIKYEPPRQTVLSRWPATVARPSYNQKYVQQPMNAVRSLDVE